MHQKTETGVMIELKEKAGIYAEENVINVLKEAFAKVYADGYRDGYKDRENEIPVDLRDSITEYVDLGLPSGTLWSTDFEKEDGNVCYMTYGDASQFNIPTIRQWNELVQKCQWKYSNKSEGHYYECIGPNGKILRFQPFGYIETEIDIVYSERTYFWFTNDEGGTSGYNTANIWGTQAHRRNLSKFTGYKIPVRLVKSK